MEKFPVIDLTPYLEWQKCGNAATETIIPQLCSEVSRTLKETGAVLIRDPRCTVEDNDIFLDMMEKYFEQPSEFKRMQERPELHYQVGVTPEGVEVPRSLVDAEMQEKLAGFGQESRPIMPKGADPKWRYMWRIGPRPVNTKFVELNAEPVVPNGFDGWKEKMDSWGFKMVNAIQVVAEMAALGFGLPKDAFTELMHQGPHLLAPTGSDLARHGQKGVVFAGYHYDLNFLTIHGRSRFPGLNIWLRNGEKVEVKVPVGCLLIQTGKQIEWLTAGECIAGMHEVVVTDRTLEAIKLASEQGRSLWRVSSTYRQMRRKEQDRLSRMEADYQRRKEVAEFEIRREQRLKETEERTAKKRAKRQKKKQRKKEKRSNLPTDGETRQNESSSDDDGDTDKDQARDA